MLKGTVSVISSDPPFKDFNVRFTTVPWKPTSDHEKYIILLFSQLFLKARNATVPFSEKQSMKKKQFKNKLYDSDQTKLLRVPL